MSSELKLRVNEIFYSIQGEGARAGEPSIFIRLSGCSAKHACYASGVVCDTEFESGKEMSITELFNIITEKVCDVTDTVGMRPWIVWTGGEPLDQLTPEILQWFRHNGYRIAIETSGIRPISMDLAGYCNHITVSPKVAEHVLKKNIGGVQLSRDGHEYFNVHELRYVRHVGQPGIPEPSLKAEYYYLSPHSDGQEINRENLDHCIKLCLANPKWRLSIQCHKMWRVL